MELTRHSFAHYLFRWPLHARLDICVRGERPVGFTLENRFGARATRGFYWSQRQAGLAIQPLFGLGFRLRWSESGLERLSVFGYGLAARARVLPVLVYVLSVLARVLSVNLGESARIGKFGKRNHRVFRHSAKNVHSTGFHLDSKLE